MEKIRNSIYLKALLHCISGDSTDGIYELVAPHIEKSVMGDKHIDEIIARASELSAGIDDGNSMQVNKNWTGSSTRMLALAESIGGNKSRHYYMPDKPLGIGKDCFPSTTFDKAPNFGALKSSFVEELRNASDKNTDAFIATLLCMLEKYAVNVPALTDAETDVSLYDFAKVTAALAVCLHDWEQEGKPESHPFLLIGADFSGIQRYIYQIISKYAAKNLKGRSFYIRLLSDAVVRMLLSKLALYDANIIYNSGGGFYLIAPNTEATVRGLEECKKELEEKMFLAHGTTLYVALDSVEMSTSDFTKQSDTCGLSRVWTELFKKREQQKFSKFSSILSSKYDLIFEPKLGKTPKFDVVTGEEITGRAQKNAVGDISKLNDQQQKLGTALKETIFIVAAKQPLDGIPDDIFGMEPAGLGTWYYFLDEKAYNKYSHCLSNCTITRLNDTELNSRYTSSDSCTKIDFYGGNHYNGKTFDALCDFGKREFSRLGVLRMDVDNLGRIFQQGIPQAKVTLCRYAALSRLFDFFFSGYLNTIYDDLNPQHSQIIYSGGDDLFIVGSWDVMIEMAARIKRDFADFTCHNPNFSISGGIAIVEAKYPIMSASQESEKEEENAKTHGSDKNSLSFLGVALNWDKEYPAVKHLKDSIASMTNHEDMLDKAFISKLQQLNEQAHIKQKMRNGVICHQVTNYRIYWLLAYTLKRMAERKNDREATALLTQCVNEVCSFNGKIGGEPITTNYHPLELWAFAARWAELELRTNNLLN